MNKLLSTPMAMAVSATFLAAVSLTACTPTKVENNAVSTEDAQRIAAEKKKAAEKKRAKLKEYQQLGSCGH